MDSKSMITLEFDKIIKMLREYIVSPMGQELVENIEIYTNINQIKHQLKVTSEARLLIATERFTLRGLKDIRPTLKRSRINAMPSIEGLLNVSCTLKCFSAAARIISRNSADVPLMHSIIEGVDSLGFIRDGIDNCIDENASILDKASSKLYEIRRQIRRLEAQVKSRIESIIRSSKYSKYLQENLVTMRQNRYVVPVKYEYRQQIPGIIHDRSASGSTLFIEPISVVESNNKLREWEQKEIKEIERILRELGDMLHSNYQNLMVISDLVSILDMLYARGQLSLVMGAVEPKINDKQYISLINAKHPLISKNEVVPIDIELGREYQALVITGPNTGGKTVTLKLVGLMQLMAQAGLHIPASLNSEVSVYNNILADIGDEQSIEQSLSTFSSHMTNIIKLLNIADDKSLVLLDELGAGTDPVEGAALAMSIIDNLISRGTFLIATTHYSELKAYAYNHQKITNGSVEFDVETLRPTYRLLIGVPGRSNALLIAKRLGLQESVIRGASKYISTEEKHVENMIAELEENRKNAEKSYQEAELLRLENAQVNQQFHNKLKKIKDEEKEFKRRAVTEAKEYINQVQKELEDLIHNLRVEFDSIQSKQQLEDSIKVTRQLLSERQALINREAKLLYNNPLKSDNKVLKNGTKEIKKGMTIKHLQWNREGVVVSDVNEREQVQVQFGSMKIWVDINAIEEINKPQEKTPKIVVTRSEEARNIALELDLRGKTIAEAEEVIDIYLDNAIMGARSQVFIIHGKGTGALRQGVRAYLQQHPQVKQIRFGTAGEGGFGVTVAELNK